MSKLNRSSLSFVVPIVLAALPQAALAYIGPGTGLSAIGALLAIVVGFVVVVFGFVWYPIKRLLRKKPKAESPESGGSA